MKRALLISTMLAFAAPAFVQASHPVATDSYHGVTVSDPYRWLEQGNDPAVKAWLAAQNAKSRAYLDGVSSRPAIATELKRIAV